MSRNFNDEIIPLFELEFIIKQINYAAASQLYFSFNGCSPEKYMYVRDFKE